MSAGAGPVAPAEPPVRPAPLAHPVRAWTREQRTTIVYGILSIVLVIVVLQLWLFTATMNAWLGGDDSVVWPGLAASTACLALNLGLLRYLRSE